MDILPDVGADSAGDTSQMRQAMGPPPRPFLFSSLKGHTLTHTALPASSSSPLILLLFEGTHRPPAHAHTYAHTHTHTQVVRLLSLPFGLFKHIVCMYQENVENRFQVEVKWLGYKSVHMSIGITLYTCLSQVSK